MTGTDWESYARRGLKELAECSFERMRFIHEPPYRCLYSGGAGIAYTFWRAACLLDEPEWLHYARYWIDHVAAAPADEQVQKFPDNPAQNFVIENFDSVYYGDKGVSMVQALIANAEDNPEMWWKAQKAFTTAASIEAAEPELLQGITGRLVGCSLLYQEAEDERLKTHGDKLAEILIDSAGIASGGIPWQNNHLMGMAHGRTGNYYALLLWSRVSGFSLPEWIPTGLTEHARSARKKEHGVGWPVDERDEKHFVNTWCNGTPGHILLCCLAYNIYRDPLFLDTAISAGTYTTHQRKHTLGTLCCGSGGAAYAFLYLNRIDPDGSWLEHAGHYGELAMDGLMDRHCRLSLFRGLAGMVCLALDMTCPQQARFPTLES